MSSQPQNEDASELEEAAEEEELLKLEEEVAEMANEVLEYRTTLPDQLIFTLSTLLTSHRPVLQNHLVGEARTLHGPDSEAGASQGEIRDNMVLSVTNDPEEVEKILLLKQKISSNSSALPVVLNRMKEYMAKIDKLESSNGIIHPAFKKKRTS